MIWIAITLSFLSGTTKTIARMTNAQLAQCIGAVESTFWNYAMGLLCSILILLIEQAPRPAWNMLGKPIPAWGYLCGVVGVLYVVLLNITVPKMPTFSMTLLIIVGQLGTGIILDVLIHHQLSWGKIAGSVLIFIGLLGNLVIDQDQKRA